MNSLRPNRQVRRTAWSQPHPKTRHINRIAGGIVICSVLGVTALAGPHIFDRMRQTYASATKAKQVAALQTALQQQVSPIISSYSGIRTSVAVIDLKTGSTINLGSQQAFTAASITKLTTAIYFLHLVETGQQSLSEPVDGSPASWQLQQMVQQSDNDSWTLLDNLVGYQPLGDYAHSIGLTSFNLADNTITASNESLLLEKLYDGKLLSRGDTDLLLSYMQDTNNETLIPAALPAGATVYHKYGEIENVVHDAAIVKENGRTFILVIFTDQTGGVNYPQRTQLIHQVTQAVVKAFD